jgi:hypothetical protein
MSAIAKKPKKPKKPAVDPKLFGTHSWSCSCSDFMYRGAKRTPHPYCKHILGVIFTLRDEHNNLLKLGFKPSFPTEEGPIGRAVDVNGILGHEWIVESASTADT